MKYSKIILSSILLLSFSSLSAESFNWSEIKTKIVNEDSKTESEDTKQYIEDNYGMNVDKKSVEQITTESKQKKTAISLILRNPQEYSVETTDYTDPANPITTTEIEETDFWGVGIEGKLDFSALGKITNQLYGEIELYTDIMNVGLVKKWFPFGSPYTNEGFSVGAGGYIGYVLKDGYRTKSDLVLSAGLLTSYNFENWQVGVNYKYDKDMISASDGFTFNIGYRF